MTSAIGTLLFALGVVALFVWAPDIVPFLKGVTAFSLLFGGAMCLIVSLGTRKSKKDFGKAINDKASEAENTEE